MEDLTSNPVLVDVTRGDGVESHHRGAAVVVNGSGEVVASWGNVKTPVLPRSAIKALQGLALVETGAADHFSVSDAELAIACASHSSEPEHLHVVTQWLTRLGLSTDDLECGATGSSEKTVLEEQIRRNETITRAHNNCSGKHTGFLATALHMGEPTKGYVGADHPVQKRLIDILQDMGEVDLGKAPRGCDGCGIPVIAMPLDAMARGFAKMASPDNLPPTRREAAKKITGAIKANPLMVAGHRRFDSLVIDATENGPKGPALVKTGAEGVYGAMLPGLEFGIALKIDDGSTRASEVVMASILDGLGVFDVSLRKALESQIEPTIVSTTGVPVGVIRATDCLKGNTI